MTEKFIAGIIGAPFGVKGFVKVHSCSGDIGHLLKLKTVIVNRDGKEQELKIEESAPSLPGLVIRFEGIDSPEKAKTLGKAKLLVKREQAAPLDDNEFYIEDLKGIEVHDKTAVIGYITDIIEGGGGDLVEIQLTNGEKKLVPLRKEFFPGISPKNGKVILENLWILE